MLNRWLSTFDALCYSKAHACLGFRGFMDISKSRRVHVFQGSHNLVGPVRQVGITGALMRTTSRELNKSVNVADG